MSRHEVESSYSLIDLLMGTVLAVVMMLALIYNPPKPQVALETKSPGDVIVQIWWPNENPVDIDLWVKAPTDTPVGYSNKSGDIFNLLRDDLGITADISGLNEEVAYSRGVPDGEYIFNVHSYSSGGIYPVRVVMSIAVRQSSGTVLELWKGEHTFAGPGDEHTYVRLTFKDGKLVGGPNYVPITIRSKVQ